MLMHALSLSLSTYNGIGSGYTDCYFCTYIELIETELCIAVDRFTLYELSASLS